MVNGAGLTSGSITGLGASGNGCGRIMGTETSVQNKLAEVWGVLHKMMEGDLVRRSWVDGSEERMWKPSLRIRLRQ